MYQEHFLASDNEMNFWLLPLYISVPTVKSFTPSGAIPVLAMEEKKRKTDCRMVYKMGLWPSSVIISTHHHQLYTPPYITLLNSHFTFPLSYSISQQPLDIFFSKATHKDVPP